MKCPHCGHKAPIQDFMDEYVESHRDKVTGECYDFGGVQCPNCKTIIGHGEKPE